MKRRSLKYVLVFGLLAAVVWLGSDTLRNEGRPLSPLEPLIQPEVKSGWRVAQPRNWPGRTVGPGTLCTSPGEFGSVTVGGRGKPVAFKLPIRDDVEQIAIPLQTAGGAITVVVLER